MTMHWCQNMLRVQKQKMQRKEVIRARQLTLEQLKG